MESIISVKEFTIEKVIYYIKKTDNIDKQLNKIGKGKTIINLL